jgi:hypothetical protein
MAEPLGEEIDESGGRPCHARLSRQATRGNRGALRQAVRGGREAHCRVRGAIYLIVGLLGVQIVIFSLITK